MSERIHCPACGAAVDAEPVRVGAVAMLEQCPACGEGPQALNLDEVFAAVAGEQVEITIGAPQAWQIARALQDFHPDHGDTPAADLERLVAEQARDGQLTVALPRLIAGPFAEAVRARYPLLTVSADAALVRFGTGNAGAPMFFADDGDAAMNAAIDAARARVGEFLDRLRAPQPGDSNFAVKVPLPTDSGEVEHIWLGEVHVEGDAFVGLVANDPQDIADLRLGDERRSPIDRISDWLYLAGDEMVGNFTLRAAEGPVADEPTAGTSPPTPAGGILHRLARLFGLAADAPPPPPPAREIAASIWSSLQRAFPPEQEYVLLAANGLPERAAAALAEIAAAFGRTGLRPVCDLAAPTIRDERGDLVPIRVAVAAHEGLSCGGYFLPSLGRITYDVSSELSDGRHLLTTTAEANKFDAPPEIATVTLPAGTSLDATLAAHRERLAAVRRELPGIGVTAPETPVAVLDDARRSSRRRHAFRRQVGWLTESEFRRLQPADADETLMAAVYREIRDLASRDAA